MTRKRHSVPTRPRPSSPHAVSAIANNDCNRACEYVGLTFCTARSPIHSVSGFVSGRTISEDIPHLLITPTPFTPPTYQARITLRGSCPDGSETTRNAR